MHPFRCLYENGWWYTLRKVFSKLFRTPDPEADPRWELHRQKFMNRHPERFQTPAQPALVDPTVGISAKKSAKCNEPYRNTSKTGINTFNYLECVLRNTQPIDRMVVPSSGNLRLNLVTDSLGGSSLFGGVATSLVLASRFASDNGMSLRIITRDEPANAVDYYQILQMNAVLPPKDVAFFCDSGRDGNGKATYKLEISEDDVFLATSWWSAEAIRKTTIRKHFYYLLQEVETFFYPHGGEQYLCSKMMEDPNITYIVNSHFLWDYYASENYSTIMTHGCYFEPAFSSAIYEEPAFLQHMESNKRATEKYSLFFYSRPNNPRNMFGYGLVILDEAIKRGILDTEEWDIYMVGQDCPDYEFSDGYHAARLGRLSWKEYGKFLSKIDLTLSLMYTPHPSYPPYDAACSGSVVLTNKYMNKSEIPECRNIILSDLDLEEFMQKMEEAISLAKDYPARSNNWKSNAISRDWNKNLEGCLKYMKGVL